MQMYTNRSRGSAAISSQAHASYLGRIHGEPQGASRGFFSGKRSVDLPVASALPLTVSANGPAPRGRRIVATKNPRILDMCVSCGTDPASQRWHNLGVTKFLNSTDKMLSLLVASGYTNHIRDILS